MSYPEIIRYFGCNNPTDLKINTEKAFLLQKAHGYVYKKQRQSNFFGAKSLQLLKTQRQSYSVSFLQHRPLIPIRPAFRKAQTTLKVYVLVCPDKLILDVSNKAKKNFILGRLGMTFALILYS